MADILQKLFSNDSSWNKIFVFWFKFHWSLFSWAKLTINQHLFMRWLSSWHQQTSVDWWLLSSPGFRISIHRKAVQPFQSYIHTWPLQRALEPSSILPQWISVQALSRTPWWRYIRCGEPQHEPAGSCLCLVGRTTTHPARTQHGVVSFSIYMQCHEYTYWPLGDTVVIVNVYIQSHFRDWYLEPSLQNMLQIISAGLNWWCG